MARVLLVDDEPGFLSSAGELLRYHGHDVFTADTLANARRILDGEASEAVLLDLMLPDGNGLELLEEIARSRPDVARVVIMTGHPGIKTQISQMSGPGISYLTKPIDSRQLIDVLRDLDGTNLTGRDELGAQRHFGRLVGESPPMLQVYRQIERISRIDSPVLIQGETGTGKELVAEAIHRRSGRSGAYIPVNCGSLSRELAGSELFGHERGSFTGATRRHTGFFEQANGGSLFLDELTEMPFDLQPHFLRVLETSIVHPVGSEKAVNVDARIIAATNRIERGQLAEDVLRKDLYYRLSVFPIQVPALRERTEDIPLLVNYFLTQLGQQHGRQRRLSEKSLKRLESYAWPGNVRELRHVIHRAYILAKSDEGELEVPDRFESPFAIENGGRGGREFGRSIREMERELILRTLEHFEGDKHSAAEVLGVSLNTLYNRLHQYEREKAS